jgi:hypothetical protein
MRMWNSQPLGCTVTLDVPLLCGHPFECRVHQCIWARPRTCTLPGIWRACACGGQAHRSLSGDALLRGMTCRKMQSSVIGMTDESRRIMR